MKELRNESGEAVLAAIASGLDANPCLTCEGVGGCECGSGGNDPDAETYFDDCPACEGTGNGICPDCGELVAYVVVGDGRCTLCNILDATEYVDNLEYVATPRFDEHSSFHGAA